MAMGARYPPGSVHALPRALLDRTAALDAVTWDPRASKGPSGDTQFSPTGPIGAYRVRQTSGHKLATGALGKLPAPS